MALFGLIAEGKSDFPVLKNILIGLFETDIFNEIRELQPLLDATAEEDIQEFGGWFKVFEYCRSEAFRGAFQRIDYIVIQIDSDVSEQTHYDVKQTDENGLKLSPEQLIEKIKDKFYSIIKEAFGEDFLEKVKHRIIFAISVNEIECWLLPLFYTDKLKSSTNNCDYRLHQKAGSFRKETKPYDKISKEYRKSKVIQKAYPENPSLKIFVESVLAKNIIP